MIRRALLARLLGGLTVAAPIGGLVVATGRTGKLDELLQGLVGDMAVAREMGRQYLASLPDMTGLARAKARLSESASRGGSALRAAVGTAAAADFAAGEVVVVAGWVLARAEAETLALIALT
jgi:hypothetical protein